MSDRSTLASLVLVLAALAMHCGSDDNQGGSGGKSGSGGAAKGGGGTSSGGSLGKGGTSATGGTSTTGGTSGSGATGGASGNSGAGGSAGAAGSTGTPMPTGVPGNWKLVFHDEFDGSSLDLGKWHPNWFGSTDTAVTKPVNDAEASCYDPAQVSVANGLLELTAVATTQSGCLKKDGSPASYASGLVMSDGRYEFTYGFVEARMWLPPGTGTPENWAAFWVNGQVWPEDGEIDIMETLGGGSDTRWTYHYDADTSSGVSHQQITGSPNNLISGSGWHVFAANWQPDTITFYYDGKAVGSVSSTDLSGGAKTASTPHYFILNQGLSLDYPIKVPSTLKVDYVRHWQ